MVRISSYLPEGDGFPIAGEGKQTVRVDAVYPQQSKSGKNMVVFEFSARNGAKLFHYCMNEGDNRWMLKKTLTAITGKKQPSGPVSFDTDDLLGRELKVQIFHETWEGKTRAKVGDVIPSKDISPGQEDMFPDDEVPFD
jgi:hypothetical protein